MQSAVTESSEPRTLLVTDEQVPALARFFSDVWDSRDDAEDLLEARRRQADANPAEPGSVPRSYAFLLGEEVVGYLGTIPTRFWDGATESVSCWLKGFMVAPEHRNGPVGFSVLREASRHEGATGAFVVAEPARRLFQALGYTDAGILTNDVYPIAPHRIAARVDAAMLEGRVPGILVRAIRIAQRIGVAALGGSIVTLLLRLRRSVRRLRDSSFRLAIGADAITNAELDALWSRMKPGLEAASVRDARYLRWRYDAPDDPSYTFVGLRRQGELAGLAVLRRPGDGGDDPRLRGLKISSVSDLLFPVDDPAAGRALLVAAEVVGARLGADALLCSVSHPAARAAVRSHGFLSLPGTVHFVFRRKGLDSLPLEISRWWLTRGDANSDGGLA